MQNSDDSSIITDLHVSSTGSLSSIREAVRSPPKEISDLKRAQLTSARAAAVVSRKKNRPPISRHDCTRFGRFWGRFLTARPIEFSMFFGHRSYTHVRSRKRWFNISLICWKRCQNSMLRTLKERLRLQPV